MNIEQRNKKKSLETMEKYSVSGFDFPGLVRIGRETKNRMVFSQREEELRHERRRNCERTLL